MITTIQPYFQTILTVLNIVIILYGFYKFLGKPRDTLEKRIVELDTRLKALEDRVKEGDKNIDVNGDALEAIQKCLLALIEFEISYCTSTGYGNTEELKEAKKELHSYLARR